MLKQIKLSTYTLLLFALISACVKDNEEIIPNVKFQGKIDTNIGFIGKDRFLINSENVYPFTNLGVGGLAVYISKPLVYAFDRMCTNEASYSSIVTINNDGYCECPTCGSIFSIETEYGAIIKGPAKWPLKRYRSEMEGNNIIYVAN